MRNKTKSLVETVDLRGITRETDLVKVTVSLSDFDHHGDEWLILGQASLHHNERMNTWALIARMDCTDFEHDSAYALSLPLIGLQLGSVYYNSTHLIGWVDPNADDPDCPKFRVPNSSDYDPRKHPDAIKCPDCIGGEDSGEPHIIVPEGLYQPPFDKDLYRKVRGKRVAITFSPARKDN